MNANDIAHKSLNAAKEWAKSKLIPRYGDISGFNANIQNEEEKLYNARAQKATEQLKQQYGLNANQVALLMPLLTQTHGEITADIMTYINEMTAAKQNQDYNSEAAQAARQRAAGINPDLNGIDSGEGAMPGASGIMGSNQESSTGNACKAKAAQITGTLMQAITLGLNAFGIIQGQLASSIESGASAAGLDILNLEGDAEGKINIEGELSKLVSSRLFRNRAERRAYMQEVARRGNAIDIVTERLNRKTALNEARINSVISEYKGNQNYIQNAIHLIDVKQKIDITAAEHDNLIAQRNKQFLIDHPEYSEAELQARLQTANTSKAESEAKIAETEAKVAEQTGNAEIRKTNAEARSAEARAATDESNRDIIKLRNENEKTELHFLKTLNDIIYGYEEKDLNTWGDWENRQEFYNETARYRQAKKYKKRYMKPSKHYSMSIPGLGSIGFDD